MSSAATTLRCRECGRKTDGTLLREQAPHTPYDPAFFVAPLCRRPECQEKARQKGAVFA